MSLSFIGGFVLALILVIGGLFLAVRLLVWWALRNLKQVEKDCNEFVKEMGKVKGQPYIPSYLNEDEHRTYH